MCLAAEFGRQSPQLTWVEPVEILRLLLRNPKLAKPGCFAYGPDFQNKHTVRGRAAFNTTQLHESAWMHRAQHEIGRDNMVLACMTNCDGVAVTKRDEVIFLYLRLGNATAPTCFDPSCAQLIATIPDLQREQWMDDETYYRAKNRLFHMAIDTVFEQFHKASEEGVWMECPDGLERKCFPLLAAHIVDHKEALKSALTKMTHCSNCHAPQGQLHFSCADFERKTTQHIKGYYEEHRSVLVDDDDVPLPGKAAEVQRRETADLGGCR